MFRLVVLVLVGVPFISSASYEPPGDPHPGVPAECAKDEDWMPPSYRGRVVGLTKNTITIKTEGYVRFTETLYLGGGPFKTTAHVQDNTKPPRAFVFHGMMLRNSELPTDYRGATGVPSGHKIGDVKYGDLIFIECRQIDGVDYCINIEIRRRAGGQVPPAIQDKDATLGHRFGSRMNAEQFLEEKWVPAMNQLGLWYLR